LYEFIIFFFSSRRRHTRSKRDWSSDVCSSDLITRAMQLGSNEERVIHEFCDQMQIPFDKIASEDFSAFMRILSLSKLLKNPNNMRGKARPQVYHNAKKRKKR